MFQFLPSEREKALAGQTGRGQTIPHWTFVEEKKKAFFLLPGGRHPDRATALMGRLISS